MVKDIKPTSQKTIARNSVIYAFKQLSSVLFPLITFSYASKALGVNGLGSVNYVQSIVTYFVVLSGLGISTYAIRHGAGIRDNQEKMNTFVSELFCINMISTLISLAAYLLVVFNATALNTYLSMSLIFALEIPFTTLGIEWIYNCYEDFAYITIRSILFQILSLVLVVLLVKNPGDTLKYAAITLFANVGSNFLNFVHSRKYVKIRLSNLDVLRHIKPVLILFGMTVATTIYTTMDTTMIGYIRGDYAVGIYSAAHKIPRVLVRLIATIRTVSLPAMAREESKKDENYRSLTGTVLSVVILLSMPIAAFLIGNNKAVILFLFGEEYLESISVLNFLSIDIVLSAISGALVYQYVLLKYKESYSFFLTLTGMIVNLVANYFFIIHMGALGAAIATCISELVVSAIAFILSIRYLNVKEVLLHSLQGLIGSGVIIGLSVFLYQFLPTTFFGLLVCGVSGCFAYLFIICLMKRNPLYRILSASVRKIKGKIRRTTN